MQADMLAAGADCYVIKIGRLKPLIEAMDSPSAVVREPAVRDVPAIGRRPSRLARGAVSPLAGTATRCSATARMRSWFHI